MLGTAGRRCHGTAAVASHCEKFWPGAKTHYPWPMVVVEHHSALKDEENICLEVVQTDTAKDFPEEPFRKIYYTGF